MTENLCTNEVFSTELGLTANEDAAATGNEQAEQKSFNNGQNLISSTRINALKGLTKIGISAGFKTSFSGGSDAPTLGNYGLHFSVTTDKVIGNSEDGIRYNILSFDLDVADMWGNPYGFNNTYYSQEKVFSIDPNEQGNVTGVSCYFYQRKNFYSPNGYYPYSVTDDGGGYMVVDNNLFVKDLKIMMGYSTAEVSNTTAFLWTDDSSTFRISDNEETYTKHLHPRLAYRDATGLYTFINTWDDFVDFSSDFDGDYPKIYIYKQFPQLMRKQRKFHSTPSHQCRYVF